MITPAVNTKWYKNCTPQTIEQQENAKFYPCADIDTALNVIDESVKALNYYGYYFDHDSSHNGYLPRNSFAVLTYAGLFGNGYILALPFSRDKVRFYYYLSKGKKNNGEQQNCTDINA